MTQPDPKKQRRGKIELREPGKPIAAAQPRQVDPEHPAAKIFELAASPAQQPEASQPTPRTPPTPPTDATHPTASPDVSPRRDFTKFANSIVRDVVAGGHFTGKSKQLYDCLYTLTRGAVVPKRSVTIPKPELMKRSGIGSERTLLKNLAHLKGIGLVEIGYTDGKHEGNEYTVRLPEEVGLKAQPTPRTPPTPPTADTPRHAPADLPSVPPVESGVGGVGSEALESTTSGDPKTSFKTKDQNTDDEAFAGLVASLKQASREVTGREPSASDRDRWKDVAELLTTELRIAAARTCVTSAPAFLAEHLRRRLRKADARQIEREVSEATAGMSSAAPSKPELSHDEIEEQAHLMTSLLRDGASINDLEEQFAPDFRRSQWHQIRSIALAQHGYESARRAAEPTAGESE
ncbi:MAG: hypothetical protein M3348_04895 [Acidobacteriota bacterium]|nr:hypothetical protein [Acidobacteriota bacterium]